MQGEEVARDHSLRRGPRRMQLHVGRGGHVGGLAREQTGWRLSEPEPRPGCPISLLRTSPDPGRALGLSRPRPLTTGNQEGTMSPSGPAYSKTPELARPKVDTMSNLKTGGKLRHRGTTAPREDGARASRLPPGSTAGTGGTERSPLGTPPGSPSACA